jgi:cytosine/adenosine deaminase-related metal-dependent hydrolase
VIAAVGRGCPRRGPRSLDVAGCVVTPGLVNTHHHLYQTLTRAVPGGQDALLFGWLRTLYPIWARIRARGDVRLATLGLAELALSGCTTSSDHLYLFPNGARLDDTIAAAARWAAVPSRRGGRCRSASRGRPAARQRWWKRGAILEDCLRVIDAFHDPAPGAMVRVGVAPCSPFSVSRELMRDAAILLARDKGVRLHTHLAENDEDVAYSLATFGCRPGQYAEDLGWTGDDVWHAHCVKLDAPRSRCSRARDRRGALPLFQLPAGSGSRRCARCGTRG